MSTASYQNPNVPFIVKAIAFGIASVICVGLTLVACVFTGPLGIIGGLLAFVGSRNVYRNILAGYVKQQGSVPSNLDKTSKL